MELIGTPVAVAVAELTATALQAETAAAVAQTMEQIPSLELQTQVVVAAVNGAEVQQQAALELLLFDIQSNKGEIWKKIK